MAHVPSGCEGGVRRRRMQMPWDWWSARPGSHNYSTRYLERQAVGRLSWTPEFVFVICCPMVQQICTQHTQQVGLVGSGGSCNSSCQNDPMKRQCYKWSMSKQP